VSIFDTVDTHPDVLLVGIAARDKKKAEAQITKYKRGAECRAYDSYDDLLGDASIDAVYIPVPNGLHFEWAIKAMRKGKHVLIEKPITSNAEQVRELRKVCEETGKVALEAFHWRFHPAAHYVKEQCKSGKYGAVTSVFARLSVPTGALAKDDIRFNYDLGGGASMDLCYVVSAVCYFAGATIESEFEVKGVKIRIYPADQKIDEAMLAETEIRTPGLEPVVVKTDVDLRPRPIWGFIPNLYGPTCVVELEKATITFENYVSPGIFHDIKVYDKVTGKKTSKKVYEGGPLWGEIGEKWFSSYRFQLEAFVDKIRGRDMKAWVDLDESEMVMRFIDGLYDKAGLSRRA